MTPEVCVIAVGPAPGAYSGYCTTCGVLSAVWVGTTLAAFDALGHASTFHAGPRSPGATVGA